MRLIFQGGEEINIYNTVFHTWVPCRTKSTICRCILYNSNVKFKIGICQMNLLSQYTPINLPPPPPPVYSSPRPVYTSAAPSAIYKSSSRSKRDPTPVPIVIEAKGLFTLYRVYVSCLLLTNLLFTFVFQGLGPAGWKETDYSVQKPGTWSDASRISPDEFSKRAARSLNLNAWNPL